MKSDDKKGNADGFPTSLLHKNSVDKEIESTSGY